jgi:transposase
MATQKITHEQLREELENGLSKSEIARKYSMSERCLYIRIKKLKASGYDPENERRHKNPETQLVSGYSTLVRLKHKDDESEGVVMEWVKTSKTAQEIASQFEALADAFSKDIPKASTTPYPTLDFCTDTIPWYSLGDSHIGMCAEEQEVGHNFDLQIAKEELCAAIKLMIDRTEPCERCVINDAGDALHYDSAWGNAKTPKSGHELQQSGTFSDMLEVYVDCLRFAVSYALTRHKFVDVIINQGNHSKTCDISNRLWFDRYYENEPRVHFLDNRNILIPYRMGNTFIVNTHTDNMKPRRVAEASSIDFRQDWGECKYRIIFGGHLHHYMKKDEFGAIYYCLNNIAANDKHGSWGGWRSRAFLTVHYISKTYGEMGELRVTAEEVQDRLHRREPGETGNIRPKVYTV